MRDKIGKLVAITHPPRDAKDNLGVKNGLSASIVQNMGPGLKNTKTKQSKTKVFRGERSMVMC